VLDYVPRDAAVRKAQGQLYAIAYAVAHDFNQYKADGELEHYICEVERLCNVKLVRNETLRAQLWRLANSISSMFTDEESDGLSNMAFYKEEFPYKQWNKEWYMSTVELDFEGMKVSAPVGYEMILKQNYGDYMVMKQNAGLHDYPFFKNQKELLQKLGKTYIE
jgi:lipopolysaccharide cholinephosphotransferase